MPRFIPKPNLFTTSEDRHYQIFDVSKINAINFPAGDRSAAASYQRVPENLKIWLWFEETHNDKRFDPDFFPSTDDTPLNPAYLPEARNLLKLAAFRVKESILDVLHLHASDFASYFQEAPGYYTLLIHPSLLDGEQGVINQNLLLSLGCTASHRSFYFLPAASPRTGLTWELGNEAQAFFTKMSVHPVSTQPEMQRQKSDLSPEGKIAVAKTYALTASSSRVKDYYFHDECSMELKPEFKQHANLSYNVLFRKIPRDIIYGNSIYIPFFALASTPAPGIKPLLVKLLEQSGLPLTEFFNKYFYEALIPFILDNARSGIYPEHLHGQNTLIKLILSTLGNQKHLIGLEPRVRYRDATDMKVAASIEPALLTTLRTQEQQPATAYTPGAYLYLASTNFIKSSIIPIIFSLEDWKAKGWLHQSTEINHSELVLPLFRSLQKHLLSEIQNPESSLANSAGNILVEFTTILCTEQNLTSGTKRERAWLNSIAKDFYSSLKMCEARITGNQSRLTLLREHVKLFSQDYVERYQALDQAQMQKGQTTNASLTDGYGEQQPQAGFHPTQTSSTTTMYSQPQRQRASSQGVYNPHAPITQGCGYFNPEGTSSSQIVAATPWQTVAVTELNTRHCMV